MRKPDGQKIQRVRRRLLAWYRERQRPFFWRNTADVYEILVSEFMLQQTQASRVQEKLPIFLKKFPDFHTLSGATKAEVIRAWRGMGYNNRALRLHELAQTVIRKYNGKLPDDPTALNDLPGIGKYTAHAIACFGFRKRVPVVDVNVERVLSRVFYKMSSHEESLSNTGLWLLAAQILPRDAYTWNQALMELGSTLCKARSTQCSMCPLHEYCLSKHLERMKSQMYNNNSLAREKRYEGIPNRLWRGKIVEALRNVNGEGSISLLKLGKNVKQDFKRDEILWLTSLLRQLEKEGIVEFRRSGNTRKAMLAQ